MTRTPSLETISTRRQRIAELARQSPQAAFTTLAHHIDIDWLREAYRRTRKDGAAGVDGQTAAEYAENLEEQPPGRCSTAPSPARYQAPPVRRVHIPKGTGPTKTRPIGIPTFEDKVLQRAVVMVLEPSTSRTFWTARTASGPDDRRIRRLDDLLAAADGDGRRLGPGGRHPKVLRHPGPRPPAETSSTRGCVTACCCD